MNRRNFVSAALGLGLAAAVPVVAEAGILRGKRKSRGGSRRVLKVRGGRCHGGSCSLVKAATEEFDNLRPHEIVFLGNLEKQRDDGILTQRFLEDGDFYLYFESTKIA